MIQTCNLDRPSSKADLSCITKLFLWFYTLGQTQLFYFFVKYLTRLSLSIVNHAKLAQLLALNSLCLILGIALKDRL